MGSKETLRKAARDKLYTKRFGIKLNMHTDADILERLEEEGNFSSYIKSLIRADIAARKEEKES